MRTRQGSATVGSGDGAGVTVGAGVVVGAGVPPDITDTESVPSLRNFWPQEIRQENIKTVDKRMKKHFSPHMGNN
jgi:hypothetical protein